MPAHHALRLRQIYLLAHDLEWTSSVLSTARQFDEIEICGVTWRLVDSLESV